MSGAKLVERQVRTRHGPVRIMVPGGRVDAGRPLVLAMPGLLGGPDELGRIHSAMGLLADGVVLPITPELGEGAASLATLTGLLQDVIAEAFADRPIVLAGTSIGATACLAARADNVRRIVAIEPVLQTSGLAGAGDRLEAVLAAMPAADPRREMAKRLLGFTPQGFEARDYWPLLEGLDVPTHVLLGAPDGAPARSAQGGLPGMLGEGGRERLAAHPRIALSAAPGAGHDVVREAPTAAIVLLHEAARRASAVTAYDVRKLDEALLEAAPPAASAFLYWGPERETFRAAYLARTPGACPVDPEDAAPCDLLVLGEEPPHGMLAALTARLAPDGLVVARWRPTSDALSDPPRPAELGLQPVAPLDMDGSAIRRFVKAARPAPRLFLQLSAFAPTLMDVRTRLPAQRLRAAPDLEVLYQPTPLQVARVARDRPKVLVLQRPAERRVEAWRDSMAALVEAGWVVVLEFDDHPHLGHGQVDAAAPDEALRPFGFVHAVQTSTPELAELFRAYNPEVAVFPNAVFDLPPFPEREPPRRVFYGALTRGPHAVAVARSLAPFTAARPDVEFVVVGDPEVFEALPTRSKILHDYMSYERYLGLMSQSAVCLSPLEPGGFRETKSDAKYLDAARAGAPLIASPTVYERTIRHGENGFLAYRPEDWSDLLTQGFREPHKFVEAGRRAWEDVRDRRMFSSQIEARRRWCWSLWERRSELTEGLQRRLQAAAGRS